MSTNSECLFTQVETDKWYYILEDYNAPKNAWDWLDYAQAYGPFATEELANEHLADNHPNPGGSTTERLPVGVEKLNLAAKSAKFQELIRNAEAPDKYSPYRMR